MIIDLLFSIAIKAALLLVAHFERTRVATPGAVNWFLNFMAKSGATAVFEMEQRGHQHVELLVRDELVLIAFTSV